MKKTKKFFCTVGIAFILTIVAGVNVSAAQQNVTVSVPSFDVIINGQLIEGYEQKYLQYPFYVYKDITYFPMTYFDCNTLGIYNYWTAETGNIITSGLPCAEYTEVLASSTRGKTAIAQISTSKISVNGTVVDNLKEEYPILNCNNVLYFPMTWRWISEFGWQSNFAYNTFSIYTNDCPYKYLVYGYSSEDLKRTYIPIESHYAGKRAGWNTAVDAAQISFKGYTALYSERFDENNQPWTYSVVIPNHMLPIYLGNGWKTFQDYWENNTHYLWYIANQKYYDGISYYEDYFDDVRYQDGILASCYNSLTSKIKIVANAGYVAKASPIIVDDFWLYDSDDDGEKDSLRLYIANFSDKIITDIKLSWDCYDRFDDPITQEFYNEQGMLVTKQNSETFNAIGDDVDIYPYSTTWIEWNVSSYSGIDNVKNIKIQKVVFSDGAIWEP